MLWITIIKNNSIEIDGTPFYNQFFICCLHTVGGEAAYYVGVQAEVQKHCNDSSLQDLNPGWVYTMGLQE